MTKKVIAIISVLKPVDDTRNYEKVARSISNTNKYEINIIGFSTKKVPTYKNIIFHPVFNFRRLSIARMIAPLKILKILIKLKPELIIVTCAELLIVSILYKILFGSKIIYDVQENYYRNIIYSGAYSNLIKYPLAWSIRLTEKFSTAFVYQYILAETIYSSQLKFANNKSLVLENKALIDPSRVPKSKINDKITFVYSGTITEHYGIFDAIQLLQKLHKSIENIKFIIIGYAAKALTQHKLHKIAESLDFIELIGIEHLVPHDQILMEMKRSDFVILPYQKNKSSEGRIPTKLYECLAMEIPIIISQNAYWDTLIQKNNAGIIHNFEAEEAFPIDQLDREFYGKHLSTEYKWESDSQKLIQLINKLQ